LNITRSCDVLFSESITVSWIILTKMAFHENEKIETDFWIVWNMQRDFYRSVSWKRKTQKGNIQSIFFVSNPVYFVSLRRSKLYQVIICLKILVSTKSLNYSLIFLYIKLPQLFFMIYMIYFLGMTYNKVRQQNKSYEFIISNYIIFHLVYNSCYILCFLFSINPLMQ
jgi:hypothetical protein